MRRIAAPMIGGMVSSTLLTLLVLPTLYSWIEGRAERKRERERQRAVGSLEGAESPVGPVGEPV